MINWILPFLHFYTLPFVPLQKKGHAHNIQIPITMNNEEDLGSSCALEARGMLNPWPHAKDRPRLISNNPVPWIQVERGPQFYRLRF